MHLRRLLERGKNGRQRSLRKRKRGLRSKPSLEQSARLNEPRKRK